MSAGIKSSCTLRVPPFRRGNAVAVDCDRREVGRGAAHLSEAGFPLVVLHVYTINTFQGIADVGIGEFPHLVGRYHVAYAHRFLLHLQGFTLPKERARDNGLSQRAGRGEFHVLKQCVSVVFDGDDLRFVAHVRNLHLVGARLEVGKRIVAVLVAGDQRMQTFNQHCCSRQGLMLSICHFSSDASRTVDFVARGRDGHSGHGERQERSIEWFFHKVLFGNTLFSACKITRSILRRREGSVKVVLQRKKSRHRCCRDDGTLEQGRKVNAAYLHPDRI